MFRGNTSGVKRARPSARAGQSALFVLVVVCVLLLPAMASRLSGSGATAPSAPRGVSAVPGSLQATARWSAPSTSNGSPITGYVVTPLLRGVAQAPRTFNSASMTQLITSLPNGKSFAFTVAAKNAAGIGPQSIASGYVTIGAPTQVRTPSSIASNGSATVSWVAPVASNGAAINGYIVTPYAKGVATTARVFNSTATTELITGLTNKVSYTFKIGAKNSFGTGVPATATPIVPSVGAAAGVQFHCNWDFWTDADRQAVLDSMWTAGMRWVRVDVGWSSLEPDAKGSYDFGLNDKCVKMASVRGFHVLETLWMTPPWANNNLGPDVPPSNVNDYGDIAQKLSARYNGAHGYGKVDAWEVWNEPDSSAWGGSVSQYVALLKAAYPRFHAGNAKAEVVVGGATNDRTWFVNQLYANGLTGASFDIMSVHPYQIPGDNPPEAADPSPGTYDWPGDKYITHTPTLNQLMAAHGDGNKPIWWTEFGWSTCTGSTPGDWNSCVTQQQQGDYIVRAMKLAAAKYPWVTNMFVYSASDESTDPTSWTGNHGLLHADLTPKIGLGLVSSYLNQ